MKFFATERSKKDWKDKCKKINDEFYEYIEAFFVACKITGLNISKIEREKYTEYYVSVPDSNTLQASFYVYPGSDEITVDMYEETFGIEVENCEELKDFNFKPIDYLNEIHGRGPGFRLIWASISIKQFYELMEILEKWWIYK